jgi:hypothetical protein
VSVGVSHLKNGEQWRVGSAERLVDVAAGLP